MFSLLIFSSAVVVASAHATHRNNIGVAGDQSDFIIQYNNTGLSDGGCGSLDHVRKSARPDHFFVNTFTCLLFLNFVILLV